MTIAAQSAGHAGNSLPGPWVEAHEEPCRGGRVYRLLLNHRTHQAITLTEAEADSWHELAAGLCPGSAPADAEFVQELRDQGFLTDSAPGPSARRTLRLSVTRLELSWTGAGRLVRFVHERGARHFFHPAAVAAQIALALAGLAALAAAVSSGQHFQLRVHAAQVPVVLALSMVAIGVHEFAHALVVVHHRRGLDSAGLRLHLGTPAFYVESASALLLPRRHRLIQAAAGVWAEWQFTSLAALWLWWHPAAFAAGLVHRFVILNAVTIATNLLPFTGLDGSWILADAAGVPDLGLRSRGALTRLITAKAAARPVAPGDRALAAYSVLNTVAAAGLLATAGFFWYQLFGGLAGALLHRGPGGWLILAFAAVVLAMPAITATVPRLSAAAATVGEVRAAIAFRWQWRWRIPAVRALNTTLMRNGLSGTQLGVIAGHLDRARPGRYLTARLTAPCYGLICAGTVTGVNRQGEHVTLTAGSTWDPSCQLKTSRRATLIHISATTLHELLAESG